MGFDIVHVNLHKSFSQPHGGGGPGAGPIAVSERIEPFLPRPQVVRREGGNGSGPTYDLDHERPKSIGRLRGFQGNFGVFVRSYAYILSLGADGLAEASETAVLNANYLKARLAEGRAGKRLPVAFDRHCMHEFVLSGKPMKRELGVATLDLAKRLLDFGFHPPTVYFPLLVDEALMVEPTETETKESLDAFADAIEQILAEAEDDPEMAKQAPYTTPVRRLDEVKATRKPVVRQPLGLERPAAPASQLQHRGEEVALLLDPLQHVGRLEDERGGVAALGGRFDLLPGDRGRDGRAFAGAQRVDGDRRLALVVLGPVDEDLALAFDLLHLRDDLVGGLLLEQLGDRFGERFGLVVGGLLVLSGT